MSLNWKRLPIVLASTILTITSQSVLAKPTANSSYQIQNNNKTKILGYFARFRKETSVWKLMDDSQVQRRMRVSAGNDIEHFLDRAWGADKLQRQGDDLFTPFSMIGGAGYTSFFDLNCRTGRVCLGWEDEEGTWSVYGGPKLPAPVKAFLDGTAAPVTFKGPNLKPVVTFKSTPAKRNLNITNITGTYEREPTRFSTGTLEVKSLPCGKVGFKVFASLGGRTGGTEDTVSILDNHIVCKDNSFEDNTPSYIEIYFHGRDAVISGTNEAFCGSGVTLNGIYRKIDDRAPNLK